MLARTIHRQDRDSRLVWLELVGPRLSRSDASAPGNDTPHLYEYGWTLGYRIGPAHPEREESHGLRRLMERDAPPGEVTTVRVRLLFPMWPDRFVSVHTATIKHLSPVEKEDQWRQRMAADWNSLAPVLGGGGTVAADVTGLAPLDSVVKAVANLRATSVPQTPDALWFVRAVDDVDDQGDLHQGAEWEIPQTLLTEVGTQISGSLLVSMTPADTAFGATAPQGHTAPVLAAATLMSGETALDRLPAKDDPYVRLDVFGRSGR